MSTKRTEIISIDKNSLSEMELQIRAEERAKFISMLYVSLEDEEEWYNLKATVVHDLIMKNPMLSDTTYFVLTYSDIKTPLNIKSVSFHKDELIVFDKVNDDLKPSFTIHTRVNGEWAISERYDTSKGIWRILKNTTGKEVRGSNDLSFSRLKQ
ncbi:hypothetical protein [Paenibacillus sp. FSL P4-0288]|uniref:hypothetical protein n=1 Tax=Paenibacillus sp. FSL P4-0288 TaxID=2921633 RepID=UPI0030FC1C60